MLFNCARSLECRMSKDHHRHCWCRELLHHHLVLHRVIGIYLNVRKFIQLLDGPQSACQSQLNWRKLTNVFMNPNLHRENDSLPYTPLDPSPPSSIHLLFCLSWLILRQLPKTISWLSMRDSTWFIILHFSRLHHVSVSSYALQPTWLVGFDRSSQCCLLSAVWISGKMLSNCICGLLWPS